MSTKMVRLFLRFVTGSSVRIGKKIAIEFNSLSGLVELHTDGDLSGKSNTYW